MNETTLKIDKDEFFKEWEPDQVANLTEEYKDEIIKLFVNRPLCFKRDSYKCKNEYCTQPINSLEVVERRHYIEVHHIIPRRDFKENPTLPKMLGYECHDLINLTTLCKSCHKNYERAKLTIKLNGKEYRLTKSASFDLKKIIKEGRELRKSLSKLQKGWGRLTESERIRLIYLLMKWISRDMIHELE